VRRRSQHRFDFPKAIDLFSILQVSIQNYLEIENKILIYRGINTKQLGNMQYSQYMKIVEEIIEDAKKKEKENSSNNEYKSPKLPTPKMPKPPKIKR
jgi:hypothetical protein